MHAGGQGHPAYEPAGPTGHPSIGDYHWPKDWFLAHFSGV